MEKTLQMHLKDLREQIAQEIESIKIESSINNAVGVQIMSAKIARGINVNG
jgi:hypothetical protein